MNVSAMKSELHKLIDQTNDEALLQFIYNELSPDDWMDGLSDEQRLRLQESEEQYKKGNVVSNEAVLKKIG